LVSVKIPVLVKPFQVNVGSGTLILGTIRGFGLLDVQQTYEPLVILMPTLFTCEIEHGPGHNSLPDVVSDFEIGCQNSLKNKKNNTVFLKQLTFKQSFDLALSTESTQRKF
jgi:hypothetical protein